MNAIDMEKAIVYIALPVNETFIAVFDSSNPEAKVECLTIPQKGLCPSSNIFHGKGAGDEFVFAVDLAKGGISSLYGEGKDVFLLFREPVFARISVSDGTNHVYFEDKVENVFLPDKFDFDNHRIYVSDRGFGSKNIFFARGAVKNSECNDIHFALHQNVYDNIAQRANKNLLQCGRHESGILPLTMFRKSGLTSHLHRNSLFIPNGVSLVL